MENFKQILSSPTLILSPASLVQLATAQCRLFDSRRRLASARRVMHSLIILQLLSVEVINKAGTVSVVSVAYLIRETFFPSVVTSKSQTKATLSTCRKEKEPYLSEEARTGVFASSNQRQGVVKGVPGVPGISSTKRVSKGLTNR